jgi:hypothetical protein
VAKRRRRTIAASFKRNRVTGGSQLSNIDTRFAGRAIGVGTSEILGRADGLSMRIGPVNFQNNVSILKHARVDFLIGLDFLRRFNCEVSLREGVLKLYVRNRLYKVPFEQDKNFEICCEDEINTPADMQSFVDDQDYFDDDMIEEYPPMRCQGDTVLCKSFLQDDDDEEEEYTDANNKDDAYSPRGKTTFQQWKSEKRRRSPSMSMEGV